MQKLIIELRDESEDGFEDLSLLLEEILEEGLPPEVRYVLTEYEEE